MAEKKKLNIPKWIIDNRRKIEKIFIIIVVLSCICTPFVEINYDLTEYLPKYATSKQGIDLMEKEFGYPGTGEILIEDVSLYQAEDYKKQIEAVDGVDSVSWCNIDVYESNGFINNDDIKDNYKDGDALMSVIFKEGASSRSTYNAVNKITDLLGEKGHMMGSAPQMKFLKENVEKEMNMILSIGIGLIFIILLITTTSWFEPILFLTVIGAAVMINKGTNIFMGSISYITNNVTAVLQIAVSMDYSIFLLHTFTAEVKAGYEKNEAMERAVQRSITTILASSLTTFVGFIVMVFMNFGLGFDMGIVLAKGIVCSLVSVILLMPALLMRYSDLVDKFKHKPFLPSFEKTSRLAAKISVIALIVIVVVTVPSYVAQKMNHFMYGSSAVGAGEGTKIFEDEKMINEKFGRSNLLLAIIPNTSNVNEKALAKELKDLSYVKSVTALSDTLPDGVPESILPNSIKSQLHTEDYSRILIYTRTKSESDLAFETTGEIRQIVQKYYPEDSYLVGETPSTEDMRDILSADYNRVNNYAMIGIFLVVALSFHSPLLAILVMIPIEAAIFVNMAVTYIAGDNMIFVGYIVVSCIQQGATVDYAILSTDNYLEARKNLDKKEAAAYMVKKSMPSILTSGSILIIVGYVISFLSSIPAISEVGHLIGRGALLSVIFVVSLMPCLLNFADRFITISRKDKHDRIKQHLSKAREFIADERGKLHEKVKDKISMRVNNETD